MEKSFWYQFSYNYFNGRFETPPDDVATPPSNVRQCTCCDRLQAVKVFTVFFLLGFMVFLWVLLGFTEFYWLSLVFTSVYTGFYWVLLGFTRFY